MTIIEKLKSYPTSTESEKEEMLIELVHTYREDARVSLSVTNNMIFQIEADIQHFVDKKEFEVACALRDLKYSYQNAYDEIKAEIDKLKDDV
jgi:hypothetical protein